MMNWRYLTRKTMVMGAAFAACLALDVAAVPVGAQTAVTLNVALVASDVAAQVCYARDLEYFTAAGINVQLTPMQSGSAIVAAVASGAVDIGYSNLLSLAVAYKKGLPIRALTVANLWDSSSPSAGTLATLKSSSIRTAKDLNGKTVAVDGLNTLSVLGVQAWMDSNGGDSSTVHFVELAFSQMPAALIQRRVDAASMNQVADPNLGKPDDPLRLLSNTYDSIAPKFAFAAWTANPDWIDKHPELVRQFIAVMKKSALWANAHHQESAAILSKYIQVTPAQINGVFRAVYGTEMTEQLTQPMIDAALKYKFFAPPLQAKDLLATLKS